MANAGILARLVTMEYRGSCSKSIQQLWARRFSNPYNHYGAGYLPIHTIAMGQEIFQPIQQLWGRRSPSPYNSYGAGDFPTPTTAMGRRPAMKKLARMWVCREVLKSQILPTGTESITAVKNWGAVLVYGSWIQLLTGISALPSKAALVTAGKQDPLSVYFKYFSSRFATSLWYLYLKKMKSLAAETANML